MNWGLVGAAHTDLVALLFGAGSILSSVVNVVVGLAGLFQILQWKVIQRRWQADVRMALADSRSGRGLSPDSGKELSWARL